MTTLYNNYNIRPSTTDDYSNLQLLTSTMTTDIDISNNRKRVNSINSNDDSSDESFNNIPTTKKSRKSSSKSNNNNNNNTSNTSSTRAPMNQAVIDVGFVLSSGERIYTITSPWFNNATVEVFTSVDDPYRTILFRASVLADKYHCATNKVGMFLQRRRHNSNGLYQSTGFTNKIQGRTGLKCGGYFCSMDVCIAFHKHWIKQNNRSDKNDRNNNTSINNINNIIVSNDIQEINNHLFCPTSTASSLVDDINNIESTILERNSSENTSTVRSPSSSNTTSSSTPSHTSIVNTNNNVTTALNEPPSIHNVAIDSIPATVIESISGSNINTTSNVMINSPYTKPQIASTVYNSSLSYNTNDLLLRSSDSPIPSVHHQLYSNDVHDSYSSKNSIYNSLTNNHKHDHHNHSKQQDYYNGLPPKHSNPITSRYQPLSNQTLFGDVISPMYGSTSYYNNDHNHSSSNNNNSNSNILRPPSISPFHMHSDHIAHDNDNSLFMPAIKSSCISPSPIQPLLFPDHNSNNNNNNQHNITLSSHATHTHTQKPSMLQKQYSGVNNYNQQHNSHNNSTYMAQSQAQQSQSQNYTVSLGNRKLLERQLMYASQITQYPQINQQTTLDSLYQYQAPDSNMTMTMTQQPQQSQTTQLQQQQQQQQSHNVTSSVYPSHNSHHADIYDQQLLNHQQQQHYQSQNIYEQQHHNGNSNNNSYNNNNKYNIDSQELQMFNNLINSQSMQGYGITADELYAIQQKAYNIQRRQQQQYNNDTHQVY